MIEDVTTVATSKLPLNNPIPKLSADTKAILAELNNISAENAIIIRHLSELIKRNY